MTAPAVALLGTATALATGTPALARPFSTGEKSGAARAGGSTPAPGPETLGDPVYPALGNDGYRVLAYDLDLAYDATTLLVDATATLRVRTTQDLSRFSLDALGLDISAVRVDGCDAAFEQAEEKLRITPARPLRERDDVTVCVTYTADPRRTLPHTAWVPTPDGFAICPQPNSAHTVFPCNDHPSDKADFTFRITVPDGVRGVANGLLTRTENLPGDRTAYSYRSRSPIATDFERYCCGAGARSDFCRCTAEPAIRPIRWKHPAATAKSSGQVGR
ncbi:hypothetical protein [Streptomyces sp. NPDC047061]|uniref:hypothetical protein n=1 Tax=Streptomyces sp. NPDC047061 TaxID=3154605 RepID=UPI00340E5930